MRLSSPLGWLSDAIEFRRLRRRLPNAHRAWSRASGELRPESDAEYLARLRSLAREREQLRNTTERSSVPVCKYRPNSMPGRSKERRERLGSFQARSPQLYRQFPASGFWSAIATRDTSRPGNLTFQRRTVQPPPPSNRR